ncbi:MAG: putative hydrolase [Pseudonocardiales bacterium]|nr:putative hydrolase [Pseudonocardiales bacterium]
MEPLTALRRIAFLLERGQARDYRVKAFRTAAAVVVARGDHEISERAAAGTLKELPGIGDATASVIIQSLAGGQSAYLAELETQATPLVELNSDAAGLRAALRGDLHSHSDWSDGGSPIEEMAITAIELGREYQALTDHSPRLTVAHGLSADRLVRQLEVLAALRPRLGSFRLLSGIEVDILDDGRLDQSPELLGHLDIVVASVHSKLSMESAAMTRRMIAAINDPQTDILGHCTGRLVGAKKRGQSTFDALAVFQACAQAGVAVEINSRPERLDPPVELLSLAVESGCLFSIDTDAHAPGQLDWLPYGCARAAECGIPADRIVTTWPVEKLLDWTGRRRR